jgi:hypothetical protein
LHGVHRRRVRGGVADDDGLDAVRNRVAEGK